MGVIGSYITQLYRTFGVNPLEITQIFPGSTLVGEYNVPTGDLAWDKWWHILQYKTSEFRFQTSVINAEGGSLELGWQTLLALWYGIMQRFSKNLGLGSRKGTWKGTWRTKNLKRNVILKIQTWKVQTWIYSARRRFYCAACTWRAKNFGTDRIKKKVFCRQFFKKKVCFNFWSLNVWTLSGLCRMTGKAVTCELYTLHQN